MPAYFEFGYFNLALVSAGESTSFLAAVVAYFNSTPVLTSAFPGGITTSINAPGTAYPYLAVTADEDTEPGLAIEDRPIDVTFTVFAGDGDTAEALAKVVRDNFDCPNQNANSTRQPLVWTEGTETFCEREKGVLRRKKGLAAGSNPLWTYEQPYCFWCDTTPP